MAAAVCTKMAAVTVKNDGCQLSSVSCQVSLSTKISL